MARDYNKENLTMADIGIFTPALKSRCKPVVINMAADLPK